MADMVRSGALRPDQVAEHRLRHTITNVVGGPELGVKVEARALEVQSGDRFAALFGRINRNGGERCNRGYFRRRARTRGVEDAARSSQ